MNWVLVSKSNALLQEYHLLHDNECKMVLKYNPHQNSARINCGTHNRLFFIEEGNALNGKIIIINEYGMQLGSITGDKRNNQRGTVVIERKKFLYQFQQNLLPELFIHEGDNKKISRCGLKTINENTGARFPANNKGGFKNCLLLGLCWYLFLPLAKENVPVYAVAV